MKRFVLILLAVFYSAPSFAENLEPVSVQLNWKHQFEFAAFYAALSQGYYRAAGLDVSLREGGPGINVAKAVADGKADFGVGNSSLIIERHRGRPVVALAALMQHSAIAILARRDLGIENVTDLAGKTIACASHACDEIEAYLLASGVRKPDIHLQDHTEWGLDVLRRGEVVATEVFSTNQPYWVRGEAHRYILLTPRSAGIDLFGNILFSTSTMVSKKPETVRRFRDATLKGLAYAMTHQKELADLILARYNTQGKSLDHLMYEAERLNDVIRVDLVEPGHMNPARWQHVHRVYARQGMLPQQFDFGDFVYTEKPEKWPAWLPWAIAALLVLTMIAGVITYLFARMNRRLRTEVAERASAEVMLQKSQAAFRQFVDDANALLSHELRTPLAVIKIHLEVLQLKTTSDWFGAPNLTAMQQAVTRLQDLFGERLKQLFASSTLISQRDRANVKQELEGIVRDFSQLWPAAVIEWKEGGDCSGEVMVARDMLRTAVFNLLENALKYGTETVPIHLELACSATYCLLSITNHCSSPLPDDLDILFEKNTRGHASDPEQGTGIGLYLVRIIAQAHDGYASATRMPDGRFQVIFALPVAGSTSQRTATR